MLRSFIRLHTAILALASMALLLAPGAVLRTFGVAADSLEVLAVARVLAGLLAVLAAALLFLPDLPGAVRGRALGGVAVAYALLTGLVLLQQIAIWSSTPGVLLTAECALHAGAFAWLARAERVPRVAAG